MRLPNGEHERHPWLIAQIAPDFELIDAWALPACGGPDEFATLLEIVTALDPANGEWSRTSRALFWLRRRLGGWFDWDDALSRLAIPGCTETSLSVRVPESLRDPTMRPKVLSSASFLPIYGMNHEWAAEISNSTVHGVLHLAWVDQGKGRYRGQMGVYVKPRGRLGEAYLALIRPFRHLIVYPEIMRQIERSWNCRHRHTGLSLDRQALVD